MNALPTLGLIWAEARGGVIGQNGGMPWHLPEDLRHFKEATLGAPVVMGRRTWESLPERFRPLPGRVNVVVSRTPAYGAPGARVVTSLEAALAVLAEHEAIGRGSQTAWVIGGAGLFREALPLASELLVTRIELDAPGGDTFAPQLGPEWRLEDPGVDRMSTTGLGYRFERYVRA